jgi:hypothetical protein
MLSVALAFWSGSALAVAPMALTPVTRVMAGLTWVGGPSPIGINADFESRLTPVVAAEFGGFLTPAPIAPGLDAEVGSGEDLFYLRHALYGDLGFRIPHHQPIKVAWDLHFRLGAGVAWSAHVASDSLVVDKTNYEISPSMAAMTGADLLFRFGPHVGFRMAGRAWGFQVVDQQEFQTILKFSPQADLSFLYQW